MIPASASLAAGSTAVAAQPDYSQHTDQQLNVLLASQLESLSDGQRRALFSEVKLRMARQKGRSPSIRPTQRRYGRVVEHRERIIKQPDGSVVRIKSQVVRVRPVPEGGSPFGLGFEKRKEAEPGSAESVAPPVMTVKEPPAPAR